jgi:cardiolipin synthase
MSPVRRAFVILFVAAIVVACLLLLAQDQVTLKTRSAVAAEDADHPNYLAGLLGVQITRGNRFTVLTNGDQLFPAMLNAIGQARRRVSFETYIYSPGRMADEFTRAFEGAARRGVRVNLVIDAVGATIDDEHVQRLEAAGCTVARFNTPAWYSLEELNYRTHRKILVVDGEVAFTGGVGIDDQWMGDAQDPSHWRDTMVEIVGPLARLIEGGFYENFSEAAGETTPDLDPPAPPLDDSGAAFVVRSSPTGAKIRFIGEGDITDAIPVKYASRKHYEQLMELGIEIYEYQPTMMHTKTFVVDGIWSMFGSANFDNRSLELNDELNVAVTSRELAARLLQDFERDMKASRRLELAAWRQRPLLQKVREQFWAAFGEVF